MAPEQVCKGTGGSLPRPKQLTFDELAALRASDEANVDAVIREIQDLHIDA